MTFFCKPVKKRLFHPLISMKWKVKKGTGLSDVVRFQDDEIEKPRDTQVLQIQDDKA